MESIFNEQLTYPEAYYSDEVKRILNSKPELPDPPKEPEKPTVVPDPGKYDSGGNRGCFLISLIVAIIVLIVTISSDSDNKGELIWPCIICISLFFFLFKTTSWEKQSNEEQREEHKKSLSTLPDRQKKYEIEYSKYLKEMDKYNEIKREILSPDHINGMRKRKIEEWLKKRFIPEYEDCEDEDDVKKGASELFFFNELVNGIDGNIKFYNDKKVPIYDAYYYPDILLICNNLYIDVEIDEPYAGNDGTPIHYITKSYGFTENIDNKRNEFLTNNGFEIIRFSEEQVFQHSDECITYVIDFINSILSANPKTECDEAFLVKKWTKDEASKMAYQHYRETYIPFKYRQLMMNEKTSLNEDTIDYDMDDNDNNYLYYDFDDYDE